MLGCSCNLGYCKGYSCKFKVFPSYFGDLQGHEGILCNFLEVGGKRIFAKINAFFFFFWGQTCFSY